MQDPVLRRQTGSEPLSLEQEYQMQQKWLTEEDSKWTPTDTEYLTQIGSLVEYHDLM